MTVTHWLYPINALGDYWLEDIRPERPGGTTLAAGTRVSLLEEGGQ